ncbi:MAG: lytic transglycosylase domain-containing protein [Acidobacteriia bacterium]|nr:lytic transglycosylase domain-containing protein [Terriglobia bacterium]
MAGAAFLAEPVWGGEYALFSGGGRLRVDRHEAAGSTITLYLGAGTIELAAAEIRGFEPDERVAPPPIVAAPPSAPEPAPFPEQLADAAANKYGLPADLVRSVMKAESSLHSNVVSPKGAIGLMQLMPGTAQALGVDPHDPAQNVEAGTRYLRALLEKYGGALRHALAAYNAGPGAVGKYGGVPPFAETVEYIRRVERQWKRGE